MGNVPSNISTNEPEDIWWTNGQKIEGQQDTSGHQKEKKKENLDDFAAEFDRKREKRKLILEEKRKEILSIRQELDFLRIENKRLSSSSPSVHNDSNNDRIEELTAENQELKRELEVFKSRAVDTSILIDKNRELKMSVSAMQSELQKLNSCVLDFEQEKADYKRHVTALKDVIKVSKEMLLIRENELKELKIRMKEIENAVNEKETSIMSNDLKKEYERQLANIRTLRNLYEERSRTYRQESNILRSTISEKNKEIEDNLKKISELEENKMELEKSNSEKYDTIKSLESNLGLSRAECRQHQAELEVINQLFSHILLAFNNSPDLDLDKLLKQLEKNHDLLKDIISNEISSEVSSALPKVLLDLVTEISTSDDSQSEDKDFDEKKQSRVADDIIPEAPACSLHNLNSPAEIAENLPKVWRVLIELLSHQSANAAGPDNEDEQNENPCFKTVVTPKGPSLVLSVSKTFFRLKELIIEKKSLEKDMNNLKQLNSHLENRLQDQEKRFEVVSTELSKTWNFVGKLQKEHHLLHTQEQILRYELAQKRKLLKELREELEYSREKWQQAREKNSKTEKEWLILRKEFASRKKTIINEDSNNSVESGYSDDREGSSDEEPGYETDISECNLKPEENCDNIIEVPENANTESTEDLQNESLEEMCADPDEVIGENTSNSGSKSESSILGVIQNEMTHITEEFCQTNSQQQSDHIGVQRLEQCEVAKTEENSSREELVEECKQTPSSSQTFEERLAARDERLKKLEGQCKALVSQVTNTSNRSVAICNKLEDLHEIYGENSRSTSNASRLNTNQDTEDSIEGQEFEEE